MPGTPSCCQGGVRPCQWIRLGSSIRFSTRTRNRCAHLGPDAEGTGGLLDSVHRRRLAVHLDAAALQPQHRLRFIVCVRPRRDPACERARVGTSAVAAAADSSKARRESMVRPPEQSHGAEQRRRVARLFCGRPAVKAVDARSVHMRCNCRAITIPAASARNDSSAITSTGGHGFAPPSMRIAGAACVVISMPAR